MIKLPKKNLKKKNNLNGSYTYHISYSLGFQLVHIWGFLLLLVWKVDLIHGVGVIGCMKSKITKIQ